jgi:hypothetical protein
VAKNQGHTSPGLEFCKTDALGGAFLHNKKCIKQLIHLSLLWQLLRILLEITSLTLLLQLETRLQMISIVTFKDWPWIQKAAEAVKVLLMQQGARRQINKSFLFHF